MWNEALSFAGTATPLLAAAAAGATAGQFDVNLPWFDFLVVLVALLGIRAGKKRGFSEELLDVIQWLVIVGGCALGYQPLGKFLVQQTKLSPFLSYLLAYVLLLTAVCLAFNSIKRLVGFKLVESDYFGRMEYVAGMGAGLVRYLCFVMVLLALMNARFYTPAQREVIRRANLADTGIALVPTLSGFQQDIFGESYTGKFVREQLPFLLITPTAYDATRLREEGSGKKTERAIDDLFTAPKKEAPTAAPKKE